METKLDRVKAIIEKIREDCLELERKGFITERGRGQLDVVKLIEEELKE